MYSSDNAFVVAEESCLLNGTGRRLCEARFREHNQEADHLANLGAEGERKVTVEKEDNKENWKAVRGFWDGSKKTDGRSGCGVMIKGVDRDKWITISKISVPLRTCTAMVGECGSQRFDGRSGPFIWQKKLSVETRMHASMES